MIEGETRMRDVARFWAQVTKTAGCWLWTGGTNSEGYGRFKIGGKMVKAHRFAFELAHGPLLPGIWLDHLCHPGDGSCPGGRGCPHRRCVRESHLQPASNRENVLRGVSFSADNARKTHCKAGHVFDLANTYVTQSGKRHCRACKRECMRWRRARSTLLAAAAR
jgi:hypothetical protein